MDEMDTHTETGISNLTFKILYVCILHKLHELTYRGYHEKGTLSYLGAQE